NAIAALYSNDAVSMPANSPLLVGHDAILKYNQDFLKVPHLAMTGESETIRFSDDGTMAYDTGKYSVSYVDAKGHTIKDEGKFLNVLKKVDGKWKIMVDAFSSNLAPQK
ncbi:MAG TPA: nuclear transport factor 2 family protein, partial [Gemmatimonadales bacterium]|nr:nuclear transport factor 2 family protein [Gemmatimonadales bacterium]